MNKLSQLILKDRKPDSWDNSFFLSAALWSVRSHDSQTQCGAVLVKDKRIISTGYNGFISDTTQYYRGKDLKNTRL